MSLSGVSSAGAQQLQTRASLQTEIVKQQLTQDQGIAEAIKQSVEEGKEKSKPGFGLGDNLDVTV